MSYPYCMAVMLMTGHVFITDFTEEKLKDAEFMGKIKEVGKKCRLEIDPELDKAYPQQYSAIVQVKLKDGKTLEKYIESPRGHYPENPVDEDKIREKFMMLATQVISPEKADEIRRMIQDLDQLRNIGDLANLMSP